MAQKPKKKKVPRGTLGSVIVDLLRQGTRSRAKSWSRGPSDTRATQKRLTRREIED